jgi:anti-sigma-K factor RskA
VIHDEVSELLGAYALEALSHEERDEVESHVKTCTSCSDEVAQLLSVHDSLALLALEREPPAGLRTRLMNVVELERSQWLLQQKRAAETRAEAIKTPWWKRVPKLAYGASAALLAVVVVLALVLANRNTVTTRIYHGGALAQVVKGIHVAGALGVVGVRSDHSTDVTFTNLPTLPKGLAYELWFIPAKGSPVPIAGFEASTDHSFHARYFKDASPYQLAAVTIERAPGHWPAPSANSAAIGVKLTS